MMINGRIEDIIKGLAKLTKNYVLSSEQILQNKEWDKIDKVIIKESAKRFEEISSMSLEFRMEKS